MARSRSIRRWAAIHKWSSLISTAFLLVIFVTGLPLLFRDEIDQWLDPHVYETLAGDVLPVSLDNLVATGKALYPSEVAISLAIDDEAPQAYLWMAPSIETFKRNPQTQHYIRFDSRNGRALERSEPFYRHVPTFTSLMLRIHRDLLAGLLGGIFLGVMGVLLVLAIVSGTILYGPFTRTTEFGMVRAHRSRRVRWLDLHNLLGIVTLMWVFVVGATGAINELSTPLFALWQRTDVAALVAPWQEKTPPAQSALASVQAATATAQAALPQMQVSGVVFPGGEFGSPYHYLIWMKGKEPLTSRLFSPVLVDARTGKLTAVLEMPWYLRALEISRPLHFGDYGGLPLKVIWALLDVVTIIILGSGLYLWIAKRRRAPSETVEARPESNGVKLEAAE